MPRFRRTWSADKSPIGSAQDIQGSYIRGKEVFKPHHTWDLSKRKWTEDKVLKIIKEYQALVDDAFAKGNMGELPSFSGWVKSTYGTGANAGIFYARRGTPDELFRSITSGDYARDKKIELVRKIIRTNNASLKGGTSLGPLLIGTVLPSKVTNVQLRTRPPSGKGSDIRVIFSKMQTELDSKHDKVRKALAEILGNKDAIFKGTILKQLMDKTGLDRKTVSEEGRAATKTKPRVPGALAQIPEWNKVGSFVEGIPDKEIYEKMSSAQKGATYTFEQMLQIAADTVEGKGGGFTDWGKVVGKNPYQYAVATAGREWIKERGNGKITFYDKNLKKIEWPNKFSTQDTFFKYNDPERPQYKNKFYGINKPSDDALKILARKFPGHTIHDLKSQIKDLPEWKPVRDIVIAKRNLMASPERNPFTKEMSTFKHVADDIHSRLLKSSKGEFFKPSYYTVGIDHKLGMGKSLFDDFRLVTSRDNIAFHQMKSNPALAGIADKLERSIFSKNLEGKMSAQQEAIRGFYKNVGDRMVKASAEGRMPLMPSAYEEAAYNFLKKGKYTQTEGAALEKVSATIASLYNQYQKAGKDQAAIEVMFGCRPRNATGGRVSFADGSTCVWNKIKNQPVESSQKIMAGIEEGATGVLGKIRNTAGGFLNLAKKGGKFGAIAAGGAAAAGLVKTFMNDDPTTYLSDENQQKNMLIEMVTGPMVDKPDPTPEILDWQLPVLGATTAAGTAAVAPSTIKATTGRALGAKQSGITKTALKTLGRGLAASGTPLGLLALEPLHIAGQVQAGDSLGEIATNPWNYAGLAFADDLSKIATKGVGANVAKAMRLGISPAALRIGSRFLGMPGLALSLGISGYEMYDDYKKKRGWFSEE